MNKYEAKQAARKARFEERAAKATSESAITYKRAKGMAECIPFGQPILVGHHSEQRDRNFRNRIHNTYGKAFALQDKAKHYEQKAASVGTGGISSDDPEAIAKLRRELEACEQSQEKMKKANACIRRKDRAGLADLGFKPEQVEELFKPDFCGRIGFPAYALSNNNANIRRIKQRIADLEKLREREAVEVQADGYTYREDTEENRVMFIFDGKPAAEVRDVLKRHAFKWSPSRGAWVRQLNNAGLWAAKCVRGELAKAGDQQPN